MPYKFTIYTKAGENSSLKHPITVAAVLIPANTPSQTTQYNLVAWQTTRFDNTTGRRMVMEWESKLAFTTYAVKVGKSGRNWCYREVKQGYSLAPGQSCKLEKQPGKPELQWSSPSSNNGYAASQPSVTAINESGATQSIAAYVISANSIAAYHPVEHGQSITIPCNLTLQFYILSFYETMAILRDEDLQQPLLDVPINCDTLPVSSSWKLYKDHEGRIRLQNDNEVASPMPHSMGSLAASFAQMKDEIMARLVATEKSVSTAIEDIADIRGQLSEMKKDRDSAPPSRMPLNRAGPVDARIPALEAATTKLTKSFDQTREYLSEVQTFLQTTQSQVIDLDQRVPLVEGRTDQLAHELSEVTGRSRDELSTIREELNVTRESLHVRLNDVDDRVTAIEANMNDGLQSAPPSDDPVVFPSRAPSIPRLPASLSRPTGAKLPKLPSLNL